MTVHRPTLKQMRKVAEEMFLDLSDADLEEFARLMEPNIEMLNWLESEPDNVPEVRYPRTPGQVPSGSNNDFNAWARKVAVKGAPGGKLSGKRVVLKDNICLAGVPMANGASTLSFYTPQFDATVVTRILDAGGEIAGKAQCEFYSFTGNSHSNSSIYKVQNPYQAGRTSGGSSSGCGALVGGGVVEMAIGGDQGGSIRIPAGYCGCVGMKPTHGLVPYTGASAIEMTLDHLGPMTQTVADNALLLEVIAGADGLDPRQYAPQVHKYTEALGQSIKGLKVGLLKQGFGHENSQADVDAAVKAAADVFRGLGATVSEVSIPRHLETVQIWFPIAVQGAADLMMKGDGVGSNWMGLYNTSLLDAQTSWRARTHEISDMVKFVMLLGHFMKSQHRGYFYAKAQNLRRRLIEAYNAAFKDVDVLIYPTTPFTAPKIPAANCSRAEHIEVSGNMVNNVVAADLTHHPAMSIPVGLDKEGLPIGMTLMGGHYNESVLYRAAHAYEQRVNWREQ